MSTFNPTHPSVQVFLRRRADLPAEFQYVPILDCSCAVDFNAPHIKHPSKRQRMARNHFSSQPEATSACVLKSNPHVGRAMIDTIPKDGDHPGMSLPHPTDFCARRLPIHGRPVDSESLG